MNSGYFVKNADDLKKLDTSPPEDEIIKGVAEEIKSLGENSKANYEEINRRHEELKKVIDGLTGKFVAADQLEKIKKLTDDISTRQIALDESSTKRMDSIETALQRVRKASISTEDAANVEKVKQFFISCASLKNKERGVSFKEAKEMETNLEEFSTYQNNFVDYIRERDSEKILTPEQWKALSVGTDPDGGYTVLPAISNAIITRLYEADPVRQLSSVETITTGAIEWLVDWGEAGYGWEEETVAGSKTDTPQFKKKRIPVHVMYADIRASQTLLEDSGINVEQWLGNKAADRFMRAEGGAFVSGDGVGKPKGFLTHSHGTTYGTIQQVNMGATANLTADGFISVKYALIEYYLNRGTWLMNRSTVAAAMKLKDGDGNYLWKPGFSNDSQSTILALPVRMSPSMTAVGADALSVALADWKEAYMVVDRLGISLIRDNLTAIPMVKFYFRKRVGGDVINYQAIKLGKIAA